MSEPAGSLRATLTWGGAGIVLGTVIPFLEQLFLMFPPPGTSWLYGVMSPTLGVASAAFLLVAFVVLAFGVGRERGIAGSSRLGRSALVVFGALTILSAGYAALDPVAIAGGVLAVVNDVLWVSTFVRVAALVVAAISVLRAGALTGPARWALPVLALTLVGTLALSWIRLPAATTAWIWALVAFPAVLLLTGALFLVQGLRSPRAIVEPVVSAG